MNCRFKAWRLRTWALALLAALSSASPQAATPAAADGPQRAGPFEITAHARKVGDSGRFLRTGNPLATQSVREYGVRWQGRAFELPGIGKRFWQVRHLPDSTRPALLLSTGAKFHLLVEDGGKLQATALTPGESTYALQWLDSAQGQPGPPLEKDFGLDRQDDAQRTTLAGGRWLYVNRRLLLDVQTLAMVPVAPWLTQGQGEMVVEMNASNGLALAFSPGRTRFVLPAHGVDYTRNGARFDALLVIDMATGQPEALRLDSKRTPYALLDDIDARWIASHLRWVRDAGGRERLTVP